MTSQSVEAANLGNSKLTVVGAGSVGTSIAYASLIRGSARQIALYDIDTKKVEAEVKDLSHGTHFTPTSVVTGGSDISVVKDSSVII
ncbi:MAG: L-lactate dehydrogenase, partial [Propionicimonas sp.]